MKKKIYETPLAEILLIEAEQCFATSQIVDGTDMVPEDWEI